MYSPSAAPQQMHKALHGFPLFSFPFPFHFLVQRPPLVVVGTTSSGVWPPPPPVVLWWALAFPPYLMVDGDIYFLSKLTTKLCCQASRFQASMEGYLLLLIKRDKFSALEYSPKHSSLSIIYLYYIIIGENIAL